MAAVAIRLAVAAGLILTSGCRADAEVTALSEKFGVCANLPSGVSYRGPTHGPDFDLGTMQSSSVTIDVLIGGHPRISIGVIRKGLNARDGFQFLGRERSDGLDKILLGYQRGENQGPMFVMFSAPHLQEAAEMLTTKNFIVDCR